MVLSELARKLSKQQVEDFRAAFEALDKNKDGVLTAEELGIVMRELKLDPTNEELSDIINEVDSDSNGAVDFEEFLNLMAARATEVDSEKELRDAFAVFDRDGSGTIEADEIRKVMKSLGDNLTDEEIDEMIKHVDKDGNGTIDYEEFAAFMMANE